MCCDFLCMWCECVYKSCDVTYVVVTFLVCHSIMPVVLPRRWVSLRCQWCYYFGVLRVVMFSCVLPDVIRQALWRQRCHSNSAGLMWNVPQTLKFYCDVTRVTSQTSTVFCDMSNTVLFAILRCGMSCTCDVSVRDCGWVLQMIVFLVGMDAQYMTQTWWWCLCDGNG